MAPRAMNKAMTSTTQPRDVIELFSHVPTPLDCFLMHHFWDEVVVRQWDVVSLADLAAIG